MLMETYCTHRLGAQARIKGFEANQHHWGKALNHNQLFCCLVTVHV